MHIKFKPSLHRSLGLELEIQIVDPTTGTLLNMAPQLLSVLQSPNFKPEFFQSTIELNTDITRNFTELENNLIQKMEILQEAGHRMGIAFMLSGTHPFEDWRNQTITEDHRYHQLLQRIQWPVRQFLIFGTHLHIGVRDAETVMRLIRRLRVFIPHLLALSANSPFWMGLDTGLASARMKIFEELPNAGLPYAFPTWEEYSRFVEASIRTGSIDSFRDIWWDIRPHPAYGTIEIRICDAMSSLPEILSVMAFALALTIYLEQPESPTPLDTIPEWIIAQNKWRATRYGMDADLIEPHTLEVVPLRKSIHKWIKKVFPIAEKFQFSSHLEYLIELMSFGPGYSRQRQWQQEHENNYLAVVHNLIEEFEQARPIVSKSLDVG